MIFQDQVTAPAQSPRDGFARTEPQGDAVIFIEEYAIIMEPARALGHRLQILADGA